MSTIALDLGTGQIASILSADILTVASGKYATIYSLILTNTTANRITVTITINNGATDYLFHTVKIPAGSGVAKSVEFISGLTLSGGYVLKLQAASSDAFNYKLNGEIRS